MNGFPIESIPLKIKRCRKCGKQFVSRLEICPFCNTANKRRFVSLKNILIISIVAFISVFASHFFSEKSKERVDLAEKHWKHNDGDWETKKHRNEFLKVYENIFKNCNQPEWNIVPADSNWYKTYFVANKVLEALRNMEMDWPKIETELDIKLL